LQTAIAEDDHLVHFLLRGCLAREEQYMEDTQLDSSIGGVMHSAVSGQDICKLVKLVLTTTERFTRTTPSMTLITH
jgi:hypothetical protein